MKPLDLIRPYLVRNRRIVATGVVCLIVVDFLQLIIPRIIKHAIDELALLRVSAMSLLSDALMIAGIATAMGILRYVWRKCLIGMSREVEEGLRNTLFSHIQTLSARYFDRVKTGDVMAHATNDIMHIRMAVGMGVVALTDAVVMGTAAIGFMLAIHVELTAYVIIPMPMIILATRFFSKQMHQRYQEVQASFSDLTETVRESIAGIRIIKAHDTLETEIRRTSRASETYIQKNLRLARITSSLFPMMVFFSNISLALILYFGGKKTIFQQITPGDFVAFISYLGLLTWPMMATGWVINLIQRGRASLGRIHRIMTVQPDISDPKEPISVSDQPEAGEIRFESVSFTYANQMDANAPPALADIALRIRPGEFLGIAGPPGSGKTTFLNLIPRIYDATSGQVWLDHHPVQAYRLEDLRAGIAFLPQEPFLFAGTIRENIALGKPELSDTDVLAAAEKASVRETILSFPKGLDTVVGEKGVILSGGQKQRIALARCLIGSPSVLLLDDPISQVDIETGRRIIASIQALAGTRTIVLVSHRLTALRDADRILVLEEGRVAEIGTHRELMDANGYYAGGYRLQEIEEQFNAR